MGYSLSDRAMERGSKVGAQHLYRNLALMPDISSKVDRSHTTLTDLTLDLVAVGEGGF